MWYAIAAADKRTCTAKRERPKARESTAVEAAVAVAGKSTATDAFNTLDIINFLLSSTNLLSNKLFSRPYIYMARRTRRTRCWTRKNRRGKKYVVCNRSRGQKNVYRKKRKTRSKRKHRLRGGRRNKRKTRRSSRRKRRNRRHRRRRQRGGALMRLSPSAFPPGGPYKQGGSTNGLGKGYYYKNNTTPFLPDPINLNNGVGNRIVQNGGGFAIENIPGATDIRQAWWQLGTGVKNAYQAWIGGKPYPSPSPSVQPIGRPGAQGTEGPSGSGADDNIPQTYLAAQNTAAQYTTS